MAYRPTGRSTRAAVGFTRPAFHPVSRIVGAARPDYGVYDHPFMTAGSLPYHVTYTHDETMQATFIGSIKGKLLSQEKSELNRDKHDGWEDIDIDEVL